MDARTFLIMLKDIHSFKFFFHLIKLLDQPFFSAHVFFICLKRHRQSPKVVVIIALYSSILDWHDKDVWWSTSCSAPFQTFGKTCEEKVKLSTTSNLQTVSIKRKQMWLSNRGVRLVVLELWQIVIPHIVSSRRMAAAPCSPSQTFKYGQHCWSLHGGNFNTSYVIPCLTTLAINTINHSAHSW